MMHPLWKRNWILMILFALAQTNGASKLFANSLKQTESFYVAGKFEQASTSANQALKNPKLKLSERAKLYKMNGISLYMLKKNQAAADSFKRALDLEPKTQISKGEVLDESVVPFFQNERNKWLQKKQSPSARLSPDASKAKIIAQNKTYLIVESNIASASISIDGILAGNPGTKIETDPGTRVIEVVAPGYVPRKIKSKLMARSENKLRIDLQKPAPKITSNKKNQNQTSSKASVLPLPNPGIKSTSPARASSEPAIDPSVASRDVASEFNLDAQTGGQTAGVGIAKQTPAQPSYQGGYSQVPPAYMPPPAQPLYPTPYMNPYYQPGYGSPVYSAPVYPMSPYGTPMYHSPPPNYYMQPQTPITQQPSYSSPSPAITETPSSQPPAPDYYEDAGEDAELMFGDSGNRKAKSSSGTKSSSPRKNSSTGTSPKSSKNKKFSTPNASTYEKPKLWIALLPFGAGQFQNQSYVLGSLFLGAEAFALYQFYSSNSSSTRVTKEANAVANDENYCDGSEDVDKCEEDRVSYLANSKKYVSAQDSTAQLSLIAFAGLWAAGVVEALINEPLPPTPKKNKRRRFGLGIYKAPESSREILFALDESLNQSWKNNDWSIGPVMKTGSLEWTKGVGISFSREW